MKQSTDLPGWCQILDWLITEIATERADLCPDNEDGVDRVSEAPSTPTGSEHQHRTREAIANV